MTEIEEVYRASLARWGVEAQYDQAVEECAELIAALKHFKRDRIGEEQVVAELAEVKLMIGPLNWMLGEERVQRAIEEKLVKLRRLLESE